MQRTVAQFVSFALVGVIGTAVHYALLFAAVALFAWPAEAATTLGAVCGASVNYVLNYHLTFRSDAAHARALAKFMVIAGIGLAINAAVVASLMRGFAAALLPAQIAATLVVLLWGFFANRAWTFRSKA